MLTVFFSSRISPFASTVIFFDEVAAGHGGRDVGDVAHLAGQVAGHGVDVVGEVLPRAGDAAHIRLAAQLAVGADFLRHARHFRCERTELVHHRVDDVLDLQNFALRLHRNLLVQVAAGDRGGDLRHVAQLHGQVAGQLVDVVGEVLPRAGHAAHVGLAAQLAFGADFLRHARHFGRERAELIHHRVHGVLQLENFALDVDGDLLREVALGHRGGHFRDVAHLAGQVRGHQVDVIGEVLPRAGHALHDRLATELAFRADFARHARHFRRERAELRHHGVHDLGGAQEFAGQRPIVDLERHRLREVALGDRADDARDFGGRLHEVRHQRVDRFHRGRPRAFRVRQLGALFDVAGLADHRAQAFEFFDQTLVALNRGVERIADFSGQARAIVGHSDREIAAFVFRQDAEQHFVIKRVGAAAVPSTSALCFRRPYEPGACDMDLL